MKDTNITTLFSIYLSYPTNRNDKSNFYRQLKNYISIGTEISAYLIDWEKMDGFPKMHLYIPAEHEPFVHYAYLSKFITEKEIKAVNNNIVKNCQLLILFGEYDYEIDNNIKSEVQFANRHDIPIYCMPDLSPEAIQALKLSINLILHSNNVEDNTEENDEENTEE